MTIARKQQIFLEATPYYHLINRCVRRSFLCGYDKLTKKDFSHRKQWLLDRLRYLVDTFAIKVCAYAVMDNHYHLVVYVDTDVARHWTQAEVIERYARLHSTQRILELLDDQEDASEDALREIDETLEKWRDRLTSISWFEKSLNEYIARAANKEDKVNGRFWQGRFKSQPLLDDAALITCMVYVDLNPIRAGIAQTLETSDFTSIQQRLQEYVGKQKKKQTSSAGSDIKQKARGQKADNRRRIEKTNRRKNKDTIAVALPLVSLLTEHTSIHQRFHVPILAAHYFELLEVTGRAIQKGKHGHIPDRLPALVSRLGLNPEAWVESVSRYKKMFPSVVGAETAIRDFVDKVQGRCWCIGIKACAGLYRKM